MFEIEVYSQTIENEVQNTISGRDIHGDLEIKRQYANWAKDQIESLELVENVDFVISQVVYNEEVKNPQGGRPRTEYYFTLDSAKEIALASRVPLGKQYRRALIEVEKRYTALMTQNPHPPLDNSLQATHMLENYLTMGDLMGVPKHISLIEATKAIAPLGIDLTPMLRQSSHMHNIEQEEKFLEPTPLGRHWNLSGKQFNRLLAGIGLQTRTPTGWYPTDKAVGMWSQNSWTKGTKSGYNLKWNVSQVTQIVDDYLARNPGLRFIG